MQAIKKLLLAILINNLKCGDTHLPIAGKSIEAVDINLGLQRQFKKVKRVFCSLLDEKTSLQSDLGDDGEHYIISIRLFFNAMDELKEEDRAGYGSVIDKWLKSNELHNVYSDPELKNMITNKVKNKKLDIPDTEALKLKEEITETRQKGKAKIVWDLIKNIQNTLATKFKNHYAELQVKYPRKIPEFQEYVVDKFFYHLNMFQSVDQKLEILNIWLTRNNLKNISIDSQENEEVLSRLSMLTCEELEALQFPNEDNDWTTCVWLESFEESEENPFDAVFKQIFTALDALKEDDTFQSKLKTFGNTMEYSISAFQRKYEQLKNLPRKGANNPKEAICKWLTDNYFLDKGVPAGSPEIKNRVSIMCLNAGSVKIIDDA